MKINKNKICLLWEEASCKLQLHSIPTTIIMMRKILTFPTSIEIGIFWSSCVVNLFRILQRWVRFFVCLLLFKQNAYMNSSASNMLIYYTKL